MINLRTYIFGLRKMKEKEGSINFNVDIFLNLYLNLIFKNIYLDWQINKVEEKKRISFLFLIKSIHLNLNQRKSVSHPLS